MSRKPKTPRDDDGPAGTGEQLREVDAGRRFVSDDILDTERELVAEGVTLANRGIPIDDHPMHRDYDDAEAIRAELKAEGDKENPNQSLVALLNGQLREVGE